MSLPVSTQLSLSITSALKPEAQFRQQITLCGHNCLFTADPLSDQRHACRREKPRPGNHSACLGYSGSHEIPFPSRRRAGISQGGWYTNSVGRLKIYATVLETKARRGWFPVSHKNVNLNNNKHVSNAPRQSLTTD